MFLLPSVYIPVCSANICLANKKLLPCCFGSEHLPACPPLCMSASPSLSYSLQGFNANNPQVPLEAHRQVHRRLPCKVQQRLRPCWRGSVLAPSRCCRGQRGTAPPAHAVHPLPGALARLHAPGSTHSWTAVRSVLDGPAIISPARIRPRRCASQPVG